MFDFSFAELLVCFVVALVVLGPEKLPGIARTLGRWTGQARAYMRNLTSELERETQAGELRKQIDEAQKLLREQTDAAQDTLRKLSAPPADDGAPKP